MNYEMFIFMLILAHFFADYVFQSAWITEQKKIKLWPMIVHCIIYTGCIHYVLTGWLHVVSWSLIMFIFGTHFIIDKFRIRYEAKRNKPYNKFLGENGNWLPTFVDQGSHLLVLLGIIIKYRWG